MMPKRHNAPEMSSDKLEVLKANWYPGYRKILVVEGADRVIAWRAEYPDTVEFAGYLDPEGNLQQQAHAIAVEHGYVDEFKFQRYYWDKLHRLVDRLDRKTIWPGRRKLNNLVQELKEVMTEVEHI